ncbi:hypothetical protein SBA4_2840002 [Candidatus Sulfopaludibacter sp. SbA4]|nr:hypothetical protein SBA4_2840002 [Candidatus Sulfopaludibacter sp. SbA4]
MSLHGYLDLVLLDWWNYIVTGIGLQATPPLPAPSPGSEYCRDASTPEPPSRRTSHAYDADGEDYVEAVAASEGATPEDEDGAEEA